MTNTKLGSMAAGAIASLAIAGAAQAASLTPIPSFVDPAGGTTSVLGINNAGWMTGNILEPDGTNLGFVRDAGGTYTTFSVGGLPSTFGRAIDNSNNVIGYATDASNGFQTDTEYVRAPGGAVTVLQNPNTSANLHGIAQGANDAGAIVGDYLSGPGATGPQIGFVLNGASFTSLVAPGSSRTSARGIENDGTVAGWAIIGGVETGFILKGGVYSFFEDPNAAPGSAGTVFENINNNGLVSGEWNDADGNGHAFEFNSVTDMFTDIVVAGAANSSAFGLNDAGDVVVTTDLTGGPNNFVFNAASVPEPAAWAMLVMGFFGLGSALRRRPAAIAA
jgi:hypothetical protein